MRHASVYDWQTFLLGLVVVFCGLVGWGVGTLVQSSLFGWGMFFLTLALYGCWKNVFITIFSVMLAVPTLSGMAVAGREDSPLIGWIVGLAVVLLMALMIRKR